MSTEHHPNHIHVQPPPPARCLRHRVVMAACDDCRQARAQRLRVAREIGTEKG